MLLTPPSQHPEGVPVGKSSRGCRVAVRTGGITPPSLPQRTRSGTVEGGGGHLPLRKRCNPATPGRKSPQIRIMGGDGAPKRLRVAGATAGTPLLLHRRSSVAPSITVAGAADSSTALQPCNPHEPRDVSLRKRCIVAPGGATVRGRPPGAENGASPTTLHCCGRK